MRRPSFYERIGHLRIKLAPMHSLSHTSVHPDFPQTILHYHLLTEEQLDALAQFYDQRSPTDLTNMYPTCMNWDQDLMASLDDSLINTSSITSASYNGPSLAKNDEEVQMETSPLSQKPLSPSTVPIARSSLSAQSAAASTPWDGPAWAITLPYNVPDDEYIHRTDAAEKENEGDSVGNDEIEMRKRLARKIRIAMKRRMFGKFIGLYGMETPIAEVSMKLKFLEARFWQLVALDRVTDVLPQKVA